MGPFVADTVKLCRFVRILPTGLHNQPLVGCCQKGALLGIGGVINIGSAA